MVELLWYGLNDSLYYSIVDSSRLVNVQIFRVTKGQPELRAEITVDVTQCLQLESQGIGM